MTAPFTLPAFRRAGMPDLPDPNQERMQGSVPNPSRSPGIFDRVFGTTDISASEREPARDAGLLAAGLSLLKSSGPTTERHNFLGDIAGAIEEGRGAATSSLGRASALESRRILQEAFSDPDNTPELGSVVRQLLATGDTAAAAQVSDMIERQGAAGSLIQVRAGNRVELRSPTTGELVHIVEIEPDRGKVQDQSRALLGRFQQQTGESAAIAEGFRKVEAAGTGTPAGDLAMLFGFMKIIDPTSVVRESEFAQAARAGSIPTRIMGAVLNALQGTILTETQREDFLDQARGMTAAAREQFEVIRTDFGDFARNFDLDPEDVTINFFKGIDLGAEFGARPVTQEVQELIGDDALQEILDAANRVSGGRR